MVLMLRVGPQIPIAPQPCTKLGHRIRVGASRDLKGRLVENLAVHPESSNALGS